MYPKLDSKGLEYFDSKYLFEEITNNMYKELSVAKYFDLDINVENNKDIKITISLGYWNSGRVRCIWSKKGKWNSFCCWNNS